MANPLFSENAAAFRHARLQLGWSQEYFAEKAILSVATINAAEAGNRVFPKTHRAMLDAINKGRAASRPPLGILVLDYPAAAGGSAKAGAGEPPSAEEPIPIPRPCDRPSPDIDPAGSTTAPVPPSSGPIQGAEPPVIPWPDQQPILTMGGNLWRIKDACEGVVILGATGSGKTSGSGRAIAHAYLASGFGGLVLCAKPDEAALWKSYAAKVGRSHDLILFGTDPALTFNFLEHESRRQGAGANLTENLVNLFTEIASIGSGSPAGSSSDPFWERAMKSLVRNCVELLNMAAVPMTLHNLFELVRSAPTTREAIQSAEWREASACWRHLGAAKKRISGTGPSMDFQEVSAYWLELFPTLGDRTRASIVAMFVTLAEGLTRSKMRELFCSGTTVAPEDILAGRIIVIDLPVKEWGEVGRIAAVLWKYCFQKTVERRKDNVNGVSRPVFLWADECQHFVSRHDALFQATARSSRATSVYLTQSIPTLSAAMAGEREGRASVDSLLNSLGTKIFHANGDATTNRYASELIGKEIKRFHNASRGSSRGSSFNAEHYTMNFGTNSSRGYSEQLAEIVRPEEFSRLSKGGPENNYEVTCAVVQTGRRWPPDGRPYIKLSFRQRDRVAQPPRLSPKKGSALRHFASYFFPWLVRGNAAGIRWVCALTMWSFLGLCFHLFSSGRPSDTSQPSQSPVAKAQPTMRPAPATTSPVKPAPLNPIPVGVRLVENPHGTDGRATFFTDAPGILPITVRVTSHPSGRVRVFHFEVSVVMAPDIAGGPNGAIDDGDDIEISGDGYLPVKVRFQHSEAAVAPR